MKNKNKNTNSSSDLKTSSNEEFNSIINLSKKYLNNIEKKEYNNSINKVYTLYNKNKKFIEIIKIIENKNLPSNIIKNIPIINILGKYFSSNNDLFINELKSLIFSNEFNDDNINQFLKQYQAFYNIINRKIKTLLNKINTKILKYNENQEENNKNIFIEKINKKIKYIKAFDSLINPTDFKNKSGKYIQVIPYTDVMFIYFINLLMIIDYLNYYYE